MRACTKSIFPTRTLDALKAAARSAKTSIVLFMMGVAFWAQAASVHAETVTVSGLSFHVDEIVPVDDQNIKITLLGKTRIIAKDTLDDLVASEVLSDKGASSQFRSQELGRFVAASMKDDKLARASYGLAAFLAQQDAQLDELRRLDDELKMNPQFGELLKKTAALIGGAIPQTQTSAYFYYKIALLDPKWLRMTVLRNVYGMKSDLFSIAGNEFAGAMEARDFAKGDAIASTFSELFGGEDSSIKKWRIVAGRAKEIIALSKSNDVGKLSPLIELQKSDAEIERLLGPLLLSALHEMAHEALAKNDAQGALFILSKVDWNTRTPTTHELVKKALSKLQPQEKSIAAEKQVSDMLLFLSGHDEGVKNAYLSFLGNEIAFLSSKGNLDELSWYGQLLDNLGGPAKGLRQTELVEEAKLLSERGLEGLARRKLHDNNVSLSLSDKWDLLLAGYFGDFTLLIGSLLLPVLFGALMYVRRAHTHMRETARVVSGGQPSSSRAADAAQDKSFVRGVGRGLNPRRYEYEECLRLFGLEPQSDFKEIKAAYRNLVKEFHPDMHQDQDAQSSEKFIQLTNAYKKLLELRRQLGLPVD